ncbi:MAG: hypothetical protein AAF800_02020 [Planctomycetota bacterium]
MTETETETETVANADAPTPESDEPQPDTVETTTERLVPVGESIRYRKRAQAAEQRLTELADQFAGLKDDLEASRQTITLLERRQKIDALLAGSDAVDLEAARLLTEVVVGQMDEPDVEEAVRELRRQKPYLFRRPVRSAPTAMSPDVEEPHDASAAAERAAATGDRRDLLDYLRLRRTSR